MPDLVVTAPTRICDCGGWTDTWFAGYGAVLHIAVTPGVRVHVKTAQPAPGPPTISLHLENFGERYAFPIERPPGRHPLIEAALAQSTFDGMSLFVTVSSDMPPGASTGTSASLAVALLAAVASLRGEPPTPAELARAAHQLETGPLGLQSGIQDQIAAAYGGVNFVEMTRYPEGRVHSLEIDSALRAALEERLVLVYLGRAHRSSEVHDEVIRSLRDGSTGALDALRQAAVAAQAALARGDLDDFGRAMIANSEAQRRLHPSLVGPVAADLIELARTSGAIGWKVNGAGGEGGSLAVLLGPRDTAPARTALLQRLAVSMPQARPIPIHLATRGAAIEPPA